MKFLDYSAVSFSSDLNMGSAYKEPDYTAGAGIWYDAFTVQDTQWLWFVKKYCCDYEE
jgi:hypothetical protein